MCLYVLYMLWDVNVFVRAMCAKRMWMCLCAMCAMKMRMCYVNTVSCVYVCKFLCMFVCMGVCICVRVYVAKIKK